MKANKKNSLYLSYDGLLDPLGQSQIIPYLKCISKNDYIVNVLSFEKKSNLKIKKLKLYLNKNNIKWHYTLFTSSFGKIGKIFDLLKMFFITLGLIKKKRIQIIHCRSHIPALIGYILKKFFKFKLIFDFRGLWIEERFDYKIWKKNNLLDFFLFKIFKILEVKILRSSDYIICLTNSVKPYIKKTIKKKIPIEVIPCCSDFNFFQSEKKKYCKKLIKRKLRLKKEDLVLGYCGSINEIYLIKEMILFFLFLKKKYNNLFFVFITPHQQELKKIIDNSFNKNIYNNIKIYKSDREKIPMYLSCFDIAISFIKNKFSRIAMSPTKMFESFAMGIPFICNSGIGDVDEIIKKNKCGGIINIKKNLYSKESINVFKKCIRIQSNFVTKRTKQLFDISFAEKKYKYVYNFLQND